MKIPPLDDSEVFKTGVNATEIGVSFVPPGKSLLDRFEAELGVLFTDVAPEELEQYLRSHITTAGLVRDINIKLDHEGARVIITQGDHLPLCETAQDRYHGLCATIGCPVCSSILCALCLSTGNRVRIETEKWDGRRNQIIYHLRFQEDED